MLLSTSSSSTSAEKIQELYEQCVCFLFFVLYIFFAEEYTMDLWQVEACGEVRHSALNQVEALRIRRPSNGSILAVS